MKRLAAASVTLDVEQHCHLLEAKAERLRAESKAWVPVNLADRVDQRLRERVQHDLL